jgi:hypothetical protein
VMDPGDPRGPGPGGSKGSMDYIVRIVSIVIELARSTQLNILYFIVL